MNNRLTNFRRERVSKIPSEPNLLDKQKETQTVKQELYNYAARNNQTTIGSSSKVQKHADHLGDQVVARNNEVEAIHDRNAQLYQDLQNRKKKDIAEVKDKFKNGDFLDGGRKTLNTISKLPKWSDAKKTVIETYKQQVSHADNDYQSQRDKIKDDAKKSIDTPSPDDTNPKTINSKASSATLWAKKTRNNIDTTPYK